MLLRNCVLLLISLQKLGSSTVVFKTTKIECITNAKYLQNVTCRLKPINRYKSVIYMECDILETLRNVSLHVVLQKKNDANSYKPFVVDATSNVCSMLSRKIFPAISIIALRLMKRYTNVNHTCPYTGHLIGKELYMDERLLPVVLPLGEYKIILEFLEGRISQPSEHVGSLILYVDAMETRDLQKNFKRKKISVSRYTV